MKNTVYAIIIVVCLATAGGIIFTTRSASQNVGIPSSQQTWVKCLNCGDAHQMALKNYWKQLGAKMSAKKGMLLTCTKCGKDAVVEAFKCPKCGEISRKGSMGATGYDDRCPKCNFSQLEAEAEAKAAAKASR